MPAEILSESCYLNIESPDALEKSQGDTHRAHLLPAASESPILCVVKVAALNASGPNRGIVNELIGSHVAEVLKMPMPPRFGIIKITKRAAPDLPLWKRRPQLKGECLAWWSQLVNEKSTKARYNWDAFERFPDLRARILKDILAELESAGILADVIAFDDLVANVDRNIGNILGSKDSGFVLIDHDQCLGGNAWTPQSLDGRSLYANKLMNICLAMNQAASLGSRALAYYDRAQAVLPATLTRLAVLVENELAKPEIDAVNKFLLDRMELDHAASRFGLVA
ncbi:hypothetical protein [Ahniella affigens]|nr:hypothetical protein [Ahniella affigens]